MEELDRVSIRSSEADQPPGMIQSMEREMLFKSFGAVAVLLLTTSLAQAAFDAQSVAAQLQADGYTRVEVKIGQTIAKVEAIKGTTKIEVTYDIASGNVIKTETEAVRPGENTAPGVEIRDGSNDDRGGRGGNDDGPNHDVNDDHGGGNDDGPSHDANDDHGGHSGRGGSEGGHGRHGGDDD